MSTLISIAVGIGLSAATGFRVFVPLLVLSLAARGGYLPLAPGFEWIASTEALVAFAVAALAEVTAYAVPWLDNALDALATPLALLAAVLVSAAVLTDLPPFLKWSLAIIAGGGAAGMVQGATVLLRLKSGAGTGGLANPLLGVIELFGAVGTALLAISLPILALVLVLAVCLLIFRAARRVVFGRRAASPRS
ncbi:MAG: DUF4126 domain-containing protein [Candidatus Methylomirabilales bacterium]